MSNEQHNEREAAVDETKLNDDYNAFCRRRNGLGDWESYRAGYEAGAASVDRVEIVRKAFKGLALELGHGQLPDPNEFYYATSLATAMESVIASMEKGK